MTLLQAFILGIIQGATEFLPISSSAHLVLTPFFLDWEIPADQAFVFNIIVQVGTLLGVIAYFWKDLVEITVETISALLARQPFRSLPARTGWLLVLATIPAGLIGLLLKDQVEAAFDSVVATALFLLLTAALLIAGERLGKRRRKAGALDWRDALIMGVFQALAIFPGVSRSGSTITGGLLRNLDRPTAARFSFLMSIPIMLAAGGLSLLELAALPDSTSFIPALTVGFITSAITGYISIRWLLKFISKNSFYGFAVYVIALAGFTFIILFL